MRPVRRYSSNNCNTMNYGYLRFKPAVGCFRALINHRHAFVQFSLAFSSSTQQSIQESIRAAIDAKAYLQIPDILNSSNSSFQTANPFKFLSLLSEIHRVQTVDEMLQAFIPVRPRSRPFRVYSCLLSYILESPNPLPLALSVLQCTLRSGCLPVPQTHLLLSQAWVERRKKSKSVSSILQEMNSIGYSPDSGTCNFLISSLCKVDQLEEGLKVLRGMCKAGCAPDLDGYGVLIGEMSDRRMTDKVVEIANEMVTIHGLCPRQDMVVKAIRAMRANRDVWKAVKLIEFLESEDVYVGFEAYEMSLEGCLDCHQFVLAGKFVIRMTGKRFIPYIRARQRLVEGLVGVGESELASVVRQRFEELNS